MTRARSKETGRANRQLSLLALPLLAMAILLTSCTPPSDWKFWNKKMNSDSISTFISWWKAKHASALGVSVSTINTYWNQGNGTLDTNPAKNRYFDVSTDFCSNSPDTGPSFDFKQSCTRHDFGWRNLKKIDIRHGTQYNTWHNRMNANSRFLNDMSNHCAGRSFIFQQSCFSASVVYYGAVVVAS